MTRHRVAAAIAVSLAVTWLAGCGVSTQRDAVVVPDKNVPSELLSTTTSTTAATPTPLTTEITMCLASSAGPLKAVRRPIPAAATVTDILTALAMPPTAAEQSSGLSTVLTPGATGDVAGGIATVGLSADFTAASSTDQLAAAAQIVCTLTARPGIGQVQFQLDGKPVDVPRGDGSTTARPVSRDDYPTLILSNIP